MSRGRKSSKTSIDPKAWGTVGWVPVASLVIPEQGEDAYQRAAIDKHVDWLFDHFKPELFGTITVLRRLDHNGQLEVADGGHRTRAAIRLNIIKVPAYIIDCHTATQAAAIFSDINSYRKKLGFLDLHRAKLVAGDVDHIESQRIIDQFKESGVVFDGKQRLTGFVKNEPKHKALLALIPLFIGLGRDAENHRLSTDVLKTLVQYESDLNRIGASIVAEPKWAKKLLKWGNDGMKDSFAANAAFNSRHASTFARLVQKKLRFQPNPYEVKNFHDNNKGAS